MFGGRGKWLAGALVVVSLGLRPASGQTTFGSITGTVRDATGAVIPGTLVTLTNLGTSEKRTQQAGPDGFYSFVNLIPGQYRIDAEKEGFKRFTRQPIVVEVQQTAHIDIVLQLGQVSQTVEVTAQTPLLQPETSSLGQVIETRQVNELPLNGRNPMNLVALAPSVVPQGQSQGNPVGKNPFDYSNYQIGGAITNQGAEYLDGVPLNNSYINELSLIPTQDSLQEFKVQTNNLDAEWGRFAGGVINFTTKSGTNQLHGTAYEYLRNTVLNARDFFIPKRGPFIQNQFGANAGGPVYIPHLYDGRDKTFFFFSYEGFRERIGQTFVESVPTLAEKNGDFTNYRDASGNLIPIYDPTTTTLNPNGTYSRQQLSCNGTLNVICPSIIAGNPAVQFFLKEFPAPNATPANPFTNVDNYVASSSGGGNNGEEVARVDQNVSDRQHIFVRYTRWTNLNFPIDPFKTGVCQDRCTEKFTTHNAVVDDVYNFSPTTILDLRISYGRLAYNRIPSDVGLDLSQLGPAWAPLNNQVVLRDLPIPNFTGGPDSFLGNVFNSNGAGSVIIARDDTPRLAGSVTKISGRHTLQFGGEYRVDHHNYLQTNTPVGNFRFDSGFTQVTPTNARLPNGQVTGSAFASFLLGYGTGSGQQYVNPVASQQIYPALYAQDQFKVTGKLTLNLGIRWEQNGPYSERFNRISYLAPNAPTNLPQPPCVTLPAATAAAFGSSQLCLPPLKGDLGLVATSDRPERYAQNKPWLQFSPHLGFAYQWNDRTVVRGGYGLFWISNAVEFDEAPNTDGVNGSSTPWLTSVDGGHSPCQNPNLAVGQPACPGGPTFNVSNPFPNGIVKPFGRNLAGYRAFEYGQGPFALLPTNPYAYYQQWNLDVQRELPDGTLIDLAYAAAKGTHLPDFAQQLNPLPDKYLSLGSHLNDVVPNPFFGLIKNRTGLSAANTTLGQLLRPYPQYTGYAIGASGWSDSIYHSFQAKLEKRMRGNGTLLVAYTVSKMITTGDVDSLTGWLEAGGQGGIQDWNNRANERSLSSFDVPQRLVASYVLDLPFGQGKKYLANASGIGGKLVSGWGAEGVTTYQRGFPLNFNTTGVSTGPGDGARPNKTGTGALSGSPESRLNKWFNTAAFSLPPNYTFGNESRVDPVLRADGIQNWDFALFKNTRFGPEDRLNMQFRGEFFNLFNKPQFGPPNRTVGSSNFGVVSSTLNNPRLIQFALRFTF
jgi:hypothetical protein